VLDVMFFSPQSFSFHHFSSRILLPPSFSPPGILPCRSSSPFFFILQARATGSWQPVYFWEDSFFGLSHLSFRPSFVFVLFRFTTVHSVLAVWAFFFHSETTVPNDALNGAPLNLSLGVPFPHNFAPFFRLRPFPLRSTPFCPSISL